MIPQAFPPTRLKLPETECIVMFMFLFHTCSLMSSHSSFCHPEAQYHRVLKHILLSHDPRAPALLSLVSTILISSVCCNIQSFTNSG
jgi:hypothetical protein